MIFSSLVPSIDFIPRNYYTPFINEQMSKFKGWGINGNIEIGNNILLDLEDPTFIVFDINILGEDSTLFASETIPTSAKHFLGMYYDNDPEINSSSKIYNEFVRIVKTIFPFDGFQNKKETGQKRHYINSISGLSVLNKKILNYPEDKITIKISEDISMLSQYLSELYLDMTYSYASQRQLIPNNLLRFDMMLIMSDIRDMKLGKVKNGEGISEGYIDKIVENKSKFIYILHDCEFSFLNSKIHGEDITVAGFNAQPTNTPATLDIDVVFKSYSRILIPALISKTSLKDAQILDFKYGDVTLENKKYLLDDKTHTYDNASYYDFYNKLNDSFITQDDYSSKRNIKTYKNINPDDINKSEYAQALNINGNVKTYATNINETTTSVNKSQTTTNYLNKLGNNALNELKGLGSSLKNTVVNQAKRLKQDLQKDVSDVLGINMTIDKINVYYDTPGEKLERLGLFANNILNKAGNAMRKTTSDTVKNIGKSITGGQANYGEVLNNFGSILGEDTQNQALGVLTGKKIKKTITDSYDNNGNIYGIDINNNLTRSGFIDNYNISENGFTDADYNDKKPEGDVNPDGTHNRKFPNGSLQPKGKYNKKYPTDKLKNTNTNVNGGKDIIDYVGSSGDVNPDGTHNEKYPIGDLHESGMYNEKYPEGDVHPNGIHNEKYPSGDLHKKSTYNKKYPEGDLQLNGIHNEKYPEGDVHHNGIHNEKYPEGDVHPNGQHNIKYPEGDVHPNGIHNEKYPDGDVHSNAQYNEKYPEGDVHETGIHNEKFPNGDLHENSTYNKKYPEDIITTKSIHNEKYPEGDVHPNGQHNIKYPNGDLHESGIYNEKYPEGVVHESGIHNEKYPNGDLQPNGIHNEKYPEGNLQPSGIHNEKYPNGDLHENSTYNRKYPESDVHYNTQHNEKYPNGDLHENGIHNKKYPDIKNVYGEKIKENKNNLENEINSSNENILPYDREANGKYHYKEPEDENIYLNKNNKDNK